MPRNIYGATKAAAEDLCQLFFRNQGLPCVVLRTSRFFPEEDDSKAAREAYADDNLKANEFLNRRADIEDIVDAHWLAVKRAAEIGFARYIISATTPLRREHLADLISDAPRVLRELYPAYVAEYAKRGWKMFAALDRVYVNAKAREELGWRPKFDFGTVLQRLMNNEDPRSQLARSVGSKGYHEDTFSDGPFPVDEG